MSEKFIVAWNNGADSSLGVMDTKSGVVDPLPPILGGGNILLSQYRDYGMQAFVVGDGKKLLLFVNYAEQVPELEFDEYRKYIRVLSYDTGTEDYEVVAPDLLDWARAVSGVASLSFGSDFLAGRSNNRTWTDLDGTWAWFSSKSGYPYVYYTFGINLETVELRLFNSVMSLESYEDSNAPTYISESMHAVRNGDFADSSLYVKWGNRRNQAPVLAMDENRLQEVLSISPDERYVLWLVTNFESDSVIYLTDLATMVDTEVQRWGYDTSDVETDYPGYFIGSHDSNSCVMRTVSDRAAGRFLIQWFDSDVGFSVRVDIPELRELVGEMYATRGLDDVISEYRDTENDSYGCKLFFKSGGSTDLQVINPWAWADGNSGLYPVGLWVTDTLAPRAFWTAFKNTKETI